MKYLQILQRLHRLSRKELLRIIFILPNDTQFFNTAGYITDKFCFTIFLDTA